LGIIGTGLTCLVPHVRAPPLGANVGADGSTSNSMTYSYDALARLQYATAGPTGTPTWKLGFVYDRYGNRTQQNLLAGAGFATQTPTDPVTNRLLSPNVYDASGNLTNDTTHTYTYDAENRIKTVDGGTTATYTYDGGPLRVKKVAGGTTTVYIFSGSKVIAEYVNGAAPAQPTKEYVYAGNRLLATLAGSTVTYQHPDHLSTRVETDSAGTVARTFGHYPFGETWYEAGGATPWKFTSYQRDDESGLDYAIFRSYSSRLGRFAQVDPLGGHLGRPQSLNRYSYVANDPVNRTDSLGLDDWWDWWMNAANNTYRYGPLLASTFSDIDEHNFWGSAYYDLPGHSDPAAQGYDEYSHWMEDWGTSAGTSEWLKEMMNIACDPRVIQGFNDAWALQANANRPGSSSEKREAWTVIEKIGTALSTIRPRLGDEDLKASIKPTDNTIAYVHTHPERTSVPTPSDLDKQADMPNFVISRFALWVTDPKTKDAHKLRDSFDKATGDWSKPCKEQ